MHARFIVAAFAVFAVPLVAFAGPPPGDEFEDWVNRPREKFENGDQVLQAVKQELQAHYLTEVPDDVLYRAAVQGMLSAIDPGRKDANALLTPAQFAEMNVEMKGELIGIGVQFKFDSATGRADVTGLVKGSPAEKAGLRVGDALLSVDGATFKGKQIRDLVHAIRGKAATKVTLALLRDTSIVNTVVERQKITFDVVTHEALPGGIGLLSIRAFNETTPQAVREALAALKGSKGLIVDLRDNEGGMLERSIDTLKLLVPKGKVLTRLVYRQDKEEVRTNDADPVFAGVPTVVLVNGQTRSSAELSAAALRDGLKAPLLGTKTFGKWSVQMLKELPNHFVMRYTVAQFRAPDGKSYEGEGLAPDIEVSQDEAGKADGQLRAALQFLRLRP